MSISTVIEYLEDAQLPLEAVGLAYNILQEYSLPAVTQHKRCDSGGPGDFGVVDLSSDRSPDQPAELVFLAAMELALCCSENGDKCLSSMTVTAGRNGVALDELWRVSTEMFERVGARLSWLASNHAVQAALATLDIDGATSPPASFECRVVKQKTTPRLPSTGFVPGYFD